MKQSAHTDDALRINTLNNNYDKFSGNISTIHSKNTEEKTKMTLLVASWFVQVPCDDNAICGS